MDENFYNSSEEPLPVSQETSNYLWEMINQDGQFLNDLVAHSTVQPACSSLPATTDWPGDFEFSVTFGPQDLKNAKNINWVFRESEQKLYIKKDAPCPIRFSASTLMLPGAVVRAMAVYTAPKHASESVHRCPNHVRDDPDPTKFEVDHLIRSECLGATYMKNTENQRHSVLVPFENPSAGQFFSTYIYKFACFSSCSGGPNRRPLTMVFTLEQNDIVLGRRTLNLKICACPGRDSGAIPKSPNDTCSKKMKLEPEKQQVTVPKRKLEEKNKFTIKTSNLECFEFLQEMKKIFKMRKSLSGLPQQYRVMFNLLLSSSSSGSSEEEEQDGGCHKQ